MSTVVVSGRVEESVKHRADAYIRAAGKTPAQVINDVWVQISITGEVPKADAHLGSREERKRRFEEFMRWKETLPPEEEWFVNMTDDQLHDLLGERDV